MIYSRPYRGTLGRPVPVWGKLPAFFVNKNWSEGIAWFLHYFISGWLLHIGWNWCSHITHLATYIIFKKKNSKWKEMCSVTDYTTGFPEASPFVFLGLGFLTSEVKSWTRLSLSILLAPGGVLGDVFPAFWTLKSEHWHLLSNYAKHDCRKQVLIHSCSRRLICSCMWPLIPIFPLPNFKESSITF